MNDPAVDSKARHHSLADWLALHELDPASCRRVLDVIGRNLPAAAARPSSGYRPPPAELAWRSAADAMIALLPAERSLIEDTLEHTKKIAVDQPKKSRKAVTLDNGPTAYPTIVYSYHGEPRDALVIAHEFGHALQIRASKGKFVAPIMREVCAFLAERALISHAHRFNEQQYSYLMQVSQSDDIKYLRARGDRLREDLARPDTSYCYSWNYPIARWIAIRMAEQGTSGGIGRAFAGEMSVSEALVSLARL